MARVSSPVILSATSILVCTIIVLANYLLPRLWADQYSEELCGILRSSYTIDSNARQTGDISQLDKVFTRDLVASEVALIRDMHAKGVVTVLKTDLISCKATYYTAGRAEVGTVERIFITKSDIRTGEIFIPNPDYPDLANLARESKGKTILVKEDGAWKVTESEEYEWSNVMVR